MLFSLSVKHLERVGSRNQTLYLNYNLKNKWGGPWRSALSTAKLTGRAPSLFSHSAPGCLHLEEQLWQDCLLSTQKTDSGASRAWDKVGIRFTGTEPNLGPNTFKNPLWVTRSGNECGDQLDKCAAKVIMKVVTQRLSPAFIMMICEYHSVSVYLCQVRCLTVW